MLGSGSNLARTSRFFLKYLYLVLQFLDFEMIFYTSKSTFPPQILTFSMPQCAARQFENELVERMSILADRHLRPPAPLGGTISWLVLRSRFKVALTNATNIHDKLWHYSCECRAMCTARLCSTHHSRCTAYFYYIGTLICSRNCTMSFI